MVLELSRSRAWARMRHKVEVLRMSARQLLVFSWFYLVSGDSVIIFLQIFRLVEERLGWLVLWVWLIEWPLRTCMETGSWGSTEVRSRAECGRAVWTWRVE